MDEWFWRRVGRVYYLTVRREGRVCSSLGVEDGWFAGGQGEAVRGSIYLESRASKTERKKRAEAHRARDATAVGLLKPSSYDELSAGRNTGRAPLRVVFMAGS